MNRILGVAAALMAAHAVAAPRWEMRYFYDEDKSTLAISDLSFPSPQRGVAIGAIEEGSKQRGVALVTSDGGRNWTTVPLKEEGISVYFLNDSLGWMVTGKGLWQTEEGGRGWRKLSGTPKDILRVHFLDPQHGYAVGLKKSVWETRDGAKSWTKLAAADQPKTNPLYTVYTNITFPNKDVGMIVGWNRPPRREDRRLPDWVDPETAMGRREWPGTLISLETRNGGATWAASQTSVFGRIARVAMDPEGRGLAVLEFTDAFTYPSEVFEINWRTGKSSRAFRERDRAVTDALLVPGGPAYLAAIAIPGKLLRTPIPGKLAMLKSSDLLKWEPMEADYRATARRAIMAGTDAQNVWVATDTGMILKLVE